MSPIGSLMATHRGGGGGGPVHGECGRVCLFWPGAARPACSHLRGAIVPQWSPCESTHADPSCKRFGDVGCSRTRGHPPRSPPPPLGCKKAPGGGMCRHTIVTQPQSSTCQLGPLSGRAPRGAPPFRPSSRFMTLALTLSQWVGQVVSVLAACPGLPNSIPGEVS